MLKRVDINKSGGAATLIYLRFKGVPTHIYKTAERSLHLIYIAVLVRAELRVLLVKYADTPFRLNPPVPTESLPTALVIR